MDNEKFPTDFEKLKRTFDEIGIVYNLTDDSEESEIGEFLDTIFILGERPHELFISFYRDGSFKDMFQFEYNQSGE